MNILYVLLKNGTRLISQVEQLTPLEVGDPDCKLSNPFVINNHGEISQTIWLVPWESEYTNDNEFIIRSEDILTMPKPKPELVKKYLKILSDMINSDSVGVQTDTDDKITLNG